MNMVWTEVLLVVEIESLVNVMGIENLVAEILDYMEILDILELHLAVQE